MSDRNEKVRALLREGDPAANDPGLTTEEAQAMRRAVLTAFPEPRRTGWMVLALAGAAVFALASVIAFTLWRSDTSQPELVAGGRRPLPRASVGEGRGGGLVAQSQATPPHQPSAGPPASQEREPPPSPRKMPRIPVPEAPAPEPVGPPEPVIAESPQQIQFSTPGGTRVIWLLNPATE